MRRESFRNTIISLQPESLTVALETTNIMFVSIFGAEMTIKMLGYGITAYLSQGQNVFDAIIVIVRYARLMSSFSRRYLFFLVNSSLLTKLEDMVKPLHWLLIILIFSLHSQCM